MKAYHVLSSINSSITIRFIKVVYQSHQEHVKTLQLTLLWVGYWPDDFRDPFQPKLFWDSVLSFIPQITCQVFETQKSGSGVHIVKNAFCYWFPFLIPWFCSRVTLKIFSLCYLHRRVLVVSFDTQASWVLIQ